MRSFQESILSMLKAHSVRKRIAVALCLVAIATVFAVFWVLRISGLTLTGGTTASGTEVQTNTDASGSQAATWTDGTAEAGTAGVETADDTESVTDIYSSKSLLTGTAGTADDGISAVSDNGVSVASDDGISAASDDSISAASDDDISAASDEGISTASEDTYSYYFADQTTLADVAANLEDDYIIYTEIDGDYYVLCADGSLVKATSISSESSADSEGLYSVGTQTGKNLVLDCWDAGSTFANYRWSLTEGKILDSASTDYAYQIYSSAKDVYLAAEETTEVIYGDGWWGTGTTRTNEASNEYLLEDGKMLTFTVTCSADINSYAAFLTEVHNSSYITTGSNGDAWFSPNSGDSLIDSDGIGVISGVKGENDKNSIIAAGDVYTVTVTRSDSVYYDNGTYVTGKSVSTYVITYYTTDGEIFNTITATNANITGNDVYVHIVAEVGTFEVSATYAKAKASSDVSEGSISLSTTSLYNLTTLNTGTAGNTTDKISFSGDFDVTFSFTATSVVSGGDNFIIELCNSAGVYIDVCSDNTGWIWAGSANASFTADSSLSGTDSIFSAIRSSGGAKCSVRVVRAGNTFTFTITVATSDTTSVSYTLTASDYAFEDTDVSLYLTGTYISLTGISATQTAVYYDTVSQSPYTRISASSADVQITAASDGYGWTACTVTTDDKLYLIADGTDRDAIEWTGSTSAGTSVAGSVATTPNAVELTFYFARVREYTVYFDGTNGGFGPYNSYTAYYYAGSSNTKTTQANVRTTGIGQGITTYADALGNCYVKLPYALNPTTMTSRCNYYLQGWYDIYSCNDSVNSASSYYSDYTASAYSYSTETGLNYKNYTESNWQYSAIKICGDSVFYADWVMQTYDTGIGSATDVSGLITDVADTSNFITTKVFDYNDLVTFYSADVTKVSLTESTHTETWAMGTRNVDENLFGTLSMAFPFLYGGSGTSLQATTGDDQHYITTGIYSGISSFIQELFTPSKAFNASDGTGIYGMTYVGTGDYLFQYDSETGYYYFDSAKNAAFYDQGDQQFYLFENVVIEANSNGSTSSTSDFLPFNYSSGLDLGSGSQTITNTAIDYWFGMSTVIDFYLPDSIGEVVADGEYGNQTTKDDDMVFKFMGDDDVWVLLGGYLILDLGGIHGACYGEINFSTGEVIWVDPEYVSAGAIDTSSTVISFTMPDADSDEYENYHQYIHTSTIAEMLAAAGADTETIDALMDSGSKELTFYYLERGSGESNAAIYLSISPVYSLKLAKATTSDGSTLTYPEGVTFAVYTSSDFENSNPITSAKTNTEGVLEISELVPGVTYYLVETSAPEGYPLSRKYLTVSADSAGSVTVCVYSSSGERLETLACDASEDAYTGSDTIETIVASDTYKRFALSVDATGLLLVQDAEKSTNYYLLNNLSVFGAANTTYGSYLIATMTYANYLEYELPATGSVGVFRYRNTGMVLVLAAATGLLMIAFYNLVWVRKLRTDENKKGSTKEGKKRAKRFARSRDHPRQRESPG